MYNSRCWLLLLWLNFWCVCIIGELIVRFCGVVNVWIVVIIGSDCRLNFDWKCGVFLR